MRNREYTVIMTVQDDTEEGGQLPEYLWLAAMVSQMLQEWGWGEPWKVYIRDGSTALYFRHDWHMRRGLKRNEADRLAEAINGDQQWVFPGRQVRVDAHAMELNAAVEMVQEIELLESERRAVRRSRGGTQARTPGPLGSPMGGTPRAQGRRSPRRRQPSPTPSDCSGMSGWSRSSSDTKVMVKGLVKALDRGRGFGPSRGGQKNVPKIEVYDGDETSGRSYINWRYDVELLRQAGYDEGALRFQIIQSLKGEPGARARQLGMTAKIDEILHELDILCDSVTSFDDLMRELYEVRQKTKETVAEFDNRVGRAMDQIRYSHPVRYEQERVAEKRR